MPKPHMLGVRVHPIDESKNSVVVPAVVDVMMTITQLQRTLVDGFGFPRSGRNVLVGNEIRPLYRAQLEIGSKTFDVDVLPHEANPPCVVGADLIARAAKGEVDALFEVFDDELTKAVRHAAKNKKSTVLILGPYGHTVQDLEDLRTSMGEAGYRGVLVQDITDIEEQSLPEKMLLLGSIARFVVCLDSRPSGHNVELETCARAGFVTAVLRPEGNPSTWMQSDIVENHSFMEEFRYRKLPIEALEDALLWAENKVRELAASYDARYPWRNKNIRLIVSD